METDILQMIAVAGGLGGQALIIKKNRLGFYAWIASNIALIATSLQAGMYGLIVLYLIYTGMCVYGLVDWRK